MTATPQFPYGAVYYRGSNPPVADWDRDYKQAASDGMNVFRHWFTWSSLEVAPGVYNWEPYDRQLDLAASSGIRTIIAEHLTFAPEWAFEAFDGCELRDREGHPAHSGVNASCATGGYPGLCLDHQPVREAAQRFLLALFDHYRGHPALLGYDLWNECNIPAAYCYCSETVAAYQTWLEGRYGTVSALAEAWNRPSLTEWGQAHPPYDRLAYAEQLDWMQFRIDHAAERLRWRIDLLRSVDSQHLITAHGIAGSLVGMAANAADDWRYAAEVDSYGLTWVTARKGDERWKQWSAIDLVRGASRGKPFWHAEMQGGPLWLQPQVLGRPREDGRIPGPEDIRLWNLISMAGGASGVQYLRWRPLLDGPLFGAFGPYGLDGEATDRSEMASRLARWANSESATQTVAAKPVRGEVGLLIVPESEFLAHIQHGSADVYAQSVWGAYRGFFDLNVQPDYVRIEDIADYSIVYVPSPLLLPAATVSKLREWVESGGILISEGCPGYFGDGGKVAALQPGNSLRELFGVVETAAEFTPDLLESGPERVSVDGAIGPCGLVRQAYRATTGSVLGWHDDGSPAIVEHRTGRGTTLLIGTSLGSGYFAHDGDVGRELFAWIRDWAQLRQHARVAPLQITVRLHERAGRVWLWATNPFRRDQPAVVTLGDHWGPYGAARMTWGQGKAEVRDGRTITFDVPGRDAVIIELQ